MCSSLLYRCNQPVHSSIPKHMFPVDSSSFSLFCTRQPVTVLISAVYVSMYESQCRTAGLILFICVLLHFTL